jgi:hypothetical protein
MPKDQAPSSGAVVPVKEDELSVAGILAIVKAGGKVRLMATENEDLHTEILERKLAGTTAAEVLAPAELLKVKDNKEILSRPFRLDDVEVRPGDPIYETEGGLGIYVVLHTSIGTIGCGGEDIVLTALRLLELEALPQWVIINQETTSAGYKVLNMVGAREPTDPSF